MVVSEKSPSTAQFAKLSSKTLKEKTGRDWSEWIEWLDEAEAQDMSHKEIVALLKGMGSPWYRQKIALGYREAKGNRELGEVFFGYEIGVTRTFPIPVRKAWDLMTSDQGLAIWLGNLKDGRVEPGESFLTDEGITGKITVLEPHSHFRMVWKPENWRGSSTLQVRVMGSKSKHAGKSVISFHHEKLPDATDREAMRKHWEEKLAELTQLIERK